MPMKIITISREFGSGGGTIGRKVAEKLGIPCYDAEIINKMSEESGFAKEYIKEESKNINRGWLNFSFLNRESGMTNQDILWGIQKQIILDLANKGPCVIVGRCADFILKDRDDVLNVFIHASFEYRANRIVEVYGEHEESKEDRIKLKDKQRATYHRYYTDMKWGQAANYHLCLDSGKLSIDDCVNSILNLYH